MRELEGVGSRKISGRTNVVLLAYSRPELVRKRSLEVLSWAGLGNLIISIDGTREHATPEERLWRRQTIATANRLAKNYPSIRVRVQRLNKGLTQHFVNALSEGFESASNVILLEEDVKAGHAGLDFLADNPVTSSPAISAAYVRALHPRDGGERIAFFPEQWGLALNAPFFQEFKSVISSGRIEASVIESYVQMFMGPKRPLLKRRAVTYWSRLFRSAIEDPNHTDALLLYTAMACLSPYRTPWNSLVEDEGHLDDRGLHPRSRIPPREQTHVVRESDKLCASCEFRNMRGPILIGPYYWYSVIYRWGQTKRGLGSRN